MSAKSTGAQVAEAATAPSTILSAVAVVALIAAIVVAWSFLPLDQWIEWFREYLRARGTTGAILFALVYMIAVLALAPALPFSIAAAVAYGWWALALTLVSGLISAILAFGAARYLLRERIQGYIRRRRVLKAVEAAVNEQRWTILALLRLSPIIPFGVQNYVLGVTRVRLTTYALATAIGILPGSILNVWIGIAGEKVARDGAGLVEWTYLGAGLLATFVITIVLTRAARAKLRKQGIRA